jgi:16S rRNA (adenine1518-N6/adenine1519-N6)-dimethyltransferase
MFPSGKSSLPPKKSLGQHFLTDPHHLAAIAAAADLTWEDTVLEIGPGPGDLTARLAAQAGRVVAVELDDRLIEPLRNRFPPSSNIEIVHGDILELDPARLAGEEVSADKATTGQYKVVANLPYYITSAVLRHLLEAEVRPRLAVLMVQKEVAERICAPPGDLSLLAVSVRFYAEPRIVHRVPAGAFRPPPKVDSAVLRLDVFSEPAIEDVSPAAFFRVARAGFGQKRKQLANSLSAGLALPKRIVQGALEAAEIDPARRAETLNLDDWRRLSLALAPALGAP